MQVTELLNENGDLISIDSLFVLLSVLLRTVSSGLQSLVQFVDSGV